MATVEQNSWKRGDDEVAVRIEAEEVSRSLLKLTRPLVIEHGTRAVILAAGKYQGEVAAGRYDMAGDLPGFLKAINFFTGNQKVVAILLDAGTFGMGIGPYVAETADGEEIKLQGRIVLRVADPEKVLVNLMKGATRVIAGNTGRNPDPGTVSISIRTRDEIRMCVGGLVRRFDSKQLDDAWWTSDDFGNRLSSATSQSLGGLGLELVRVEWLDINGQRQSVKKDRERGLRHEIEDISFGSGADASTRDATRQGQRTQLEGDRADAALDHDRNRFESETKLREQAASNEESDKARVIAKQGKLIDVATEADDTAVAAKRAEVEQARAAVAKSLRRIVQEQRTSELQDGKTFEEAVRSAEHESGLKEVIRDDEMERLKERFTHEHDLNAIARRIEVDGIANKAQREQSWDLLIEEERRRDETRRREASRNLAETQDLLERRRLEAELHRLDHEQQLTKREQEARLTMRLREEELGVQDKESDQQFKKAQRANELLAQVKQMERSEDDANHQREMEIASSERTDRLEQMRLKAGLTPDQLLAMAVEQSPAAAEALGERYRADGRLSKEREQWLREQIDEQRRRESAERERGDRTAQQQHDRSAAAEERLLRVMTEQRGIMTSALEQMGHVAASRSHISGPTVVYPPAGSAPLHPAPPLPVANYYVHLNGAQSGPFDYATVRNYVGNLQVLRSTLVWRDGLPQWIAADRVPELAAMFGSAPPPMPQS
jgi:hypothetical protein